MTAPARTPATGTTPSGTTSPADGDVAPAERPDTADGAHVALVEPPSPAELLESAVATWRGALVEAAGASTLADVDQLGDAALDLSSAHPSGMAQLFAGRPTRLSNLVREPGALSAARRRARAVSARAAGYTQRYGIASTSLAIGVATWTDRSSADLASDDVGALAHVTRHPRTPSGRPAGPDGQDAAVRTVRAPVLLRPVGLRARGSGEDDHELELEPSIEVNPVLARALRGHGALLDPAAVARGTFTAAGFDPRGALQRLASLGEAVLEDFSLVERVVVGTFVHPGQVIVDDLDQLVGTLEHHDVVRALAGIDDARAALQVPLPEPVTGDRDPALERGVGDLDPAQQHVLDVVATGSHVFVDAPTGSDVTGTLAAIVADAAAEGRTVLYVPGHRRAAVSLVERLRRLGLGDVVLDVEPHAGWRASAARRLLGAMTLEPPVVDTDAVQAVRGPLLEHRERLRGYVDALHVPREPWGASAYDALQELARLTATRPTPATTVRLGPDVARMLDPEQRTRLARDLVRAGELGAFSLRPQDTPWYGADLRTAADAQVVRRRLDRLLDVTLPLLVQRVEQVAAETGLTRATTLDQWAEQLRMLDGVRTSLDVFQPLVFERTAADLVAATATKQWREEHGIPMGFWVRRRLRKQAKDMLRPGRPVADLHGALLEVQERRELWQAHCPAGGWPRLPESLEVIEDEHLAVRQDLEGVAEVLATTPVGGRLSVTPFDELRERLARLRSGAAALDTLPERTHLLHGLRAAGLGDLVDELAARRVDPAQAPAELDLAWWSTVFEHVLAADPALAGYDGAALGALSARYAELDRRHVVSRTAPVLAAAVGRIAAAVRRHRDQAESLFTELVEERMTSLRDTVARHPDLARRLRPVLVAGPMLVAQVLPASRTVDLVVIDAAAHLPVEAALPAIARGRQVVVVGDARCASGSAVRDLAQVLPSVALHADASRRDPYLTRFLAEHGYAGVLVPTPLPSSQPLVGLENVDGTGMPDPASSMVDSTTAEVEKVLELVVEHVLQHPDESLAVVTLTPRHADAVRETVLAEVRDNPALAAYFDAGRADPFLVVDVANVGGLRRDAVILSVGLGRTPHRRVLHTFGPVSRPGGDALLLDALGSTRHRLTVVACFGAEDLDPDRLRGPGPRLLADVLRFAAERGAQAAGHGAGERPVGGPDPDRLVLDLAERLWRHGLVVEVDHGVEGGARIPLVVGHPDLPDEMLVAVLTDDATYVGEPSVRVRDRLVGDRLARLGWSVVRVWSAAAFLDPQAEVDRIRRAVHAALRERRPDAAPMTGAVPQVPHHVGDDEESRPVRPYVAQRPATGAVPVVRPATGAVPVVQPATGATPVVPAATGAVPVVRTPTGVIPVIASGAVASVGPHDARPAATGDAPAALGPDTATPADGEQLALPVRTAPRPDVRAGLPINAYSDDQLDDLVRWLRSDGAERSRDQLADALRAELGISRRSHRVDSAVRAAVTRAYS
ncbi:hypothetical protein [Cellulomonas wangsupingiae]|uniref:Restriction endonuclease type II-like domain-containing protein n=1 Tax=Cellulomonas wangsupingiae TaxID=2968085 RepID=A0ABY5KA17_9CELL|nr:hypothetical protein [Cellulomonas wangsupingiae]MCC2334286.1 hypothetical protein [Cellulomonas wangsupingiae]UUI65962.1 hypothetical protein NP075_04295 [Cellulomonas wangsupingiae]